MPKEKKGLNTKEQKIYEIIKNSQEPITVNEIMKVAPKFNSNTVQPAIRNLLKMGLIKVYDTTVDRNIISRRFVITEEAPQIIGKLFLDEFKALQKLVDTDVLFASLITTKKNDKSGRADIDELKKIVESFKKDN